MDIKATSFDEKTYFANLVKQLAEQDAFTPYPREEWKGSVLPEDCKVQIYYNRLQTKGLQILYRPHPGFVCHLGDEPYTVTHDEHEYLRAPITNEHTRLLRQSVSRAIAAYMPPKDYANYLQHFIQTVDDPKYESSLSNAGKVAKHNIEKFLRDNLTPDSRDFSQLRAKEARDHALTRAAQVKPFGVRHPDVALALQLFRAANISYIDQMLEAVDEAAQRGELNEDQHFVATDVLRHTFDQFRVNIAEQVYLPIIEMKYNELKSEAGVDDNAAMREAIDFAVNASFGQGLYSTPTGKGRIDKVCPAQAMLSRALRNRDASMEKDQAGGLLAIYDHIKAHPAQFKKMEMDVADTLRAVISEPVVTR